MLIYSSRGEDSILNRLRRDFPAVKISNYISFFALRNYGIIGEGYQTEQVYVHAKMLIVDDRTVIIGSANINDRSFRGNRDSEIAAYIEHQDFIYSTMGGKPYKVSKFAQDLRMKLWRRYLGLSADDCSIADPGNALEFFILLMPLVCDAVYKRIWRKTARLNSTIYRYVFQVLPDNIRCESDLKLKETTSPQHTHLLSHVKGLLIEFPGDFMENDELPALDKTYVLPKSVFL
jgi:phospholipase D1/2